MVKKFDPSPLDTEAREVQRHLNLAYGVNEILSKEKEITAKDFILGCCRCGSFKTADILVVIRCFTFDGQHLSDSDIKLAVMDLVSEGIIEIDENWELKIKS